MQKHLIITGTTNEIERSKTLKNLVDNSESISIVNWLGNKTLENLFNPIGFSINTDTAIVYTNNRNFPFVEFFLYHATNPNETYRKINFVFLCRNNPFEQTTEISKRFKVLNVVKMDGELNTKNFNNLSAYHLDNKIASLLQMVEDCQNSKNFSKTEKTIFCDFYKKMILEAHVERLNYTQHTSKEIIESINVKS